MSSVAEEIPVSDEMLLTSMIVFATRLARSVASIALGLWFLAVKTCLTLALEAIHAMLVGRRSDKMLSPSSYEKGIHRNQSIISSRRRVRIRRSSGESSAAASRTGSEAEGEDNESNGGGGGGCSGGAVNGTDNTVYHSRTIKLRYRSSLKKRKEQILFGSPSSSSSSTRCASPTASRSPSEEDLLDFLNRARARTTSEMMEVDDKIMPLPNFRIKPKKWKSSSSIQSVAQQQQQQQQQHSNRYNYYADGPRRFYNASLGSVAPAVTSEVTAGSRKFTPEEERRRRALLLMRRQSSDPTAYLHARRMSDKRSGSVSSSPATSSSGSSSSSSPCGSPPGGVRGLPSGVRWSYNRSKSAEDAKMLPIAAAAVPPPPPSPTESFKFLVAGDHNNHRPLPQKSAQRGP